MDQLLIVDDEIEICELLESFVGDMFSTVKMATTLKDAIDLVNTESFSIIIFDLNLAGQNGGEILVAAKQAGNSNNNTPCLVISGHFSGDFINKNEGHVEMLAKPFSEDEITEKVFKMMSTKPTKVEESDGGGQDDIDSLFDNDSDDDDDLLFEESSDTEEDKEPSADKPNAKTTDFLKNLTKK